MDVSIIIPVYNTEKYIKQCLESLINQKTEFEYEIICVNDGSTDNSEKILEQFNKNIQHISIKNSGPGAARNLAIQKAKGQYLLFVDSDDYVEENFIQRMTEEAIKNEADVVICNFYRFRDNNSELEKVNKGKRAIYQKGAIQEVLLMEFHSCNKLFKRELMMQNLYPEDMLFEDVVAISEALIDANKIVKIEDYLYYYRRTDNSITNNLKDKNYFIKKAIDKIEPKFINNVYLTQIEFLNINCILVDLAIKVMKAKKNKQAYKDIIEPVIKKYPKWYKNPLIKKVKFKKKLYLWCLKHKMYDLIKFVF